MSAFDFHTPAVAPECPSQPRRKHRVELSTEETANAIQLALVAHHDGEAIALTLAWAVNSLQRTANLHAPGASITFQAEEATVRAEVHTADSPSFFFLADELDAVWTECCTTGYRGQPLEGWDMMVVRVDDSDLQKNLQKISKRIRIRTDISK